VYDLRHDPTDYIDKTPEELAELWRWKKDSTEPRLPVKSLQYNRCPAVAPMGVLDEASQKRLQIDLNVIASNLAKLKRAKDFGPKLQQTLELMNKQRQTELIASETEVDAQLYDSFIDKQDQTVMSAVRAAEPGDIMAFEETLHDPRLKALLPLYKARNFPRELSADERAAWEDFRTKRLTYGGEQSRLATFFKRIEELAQSGHLTDERKFILEELRLYGESIMPDPMSEA
jgi:exodeoxyribonuclease-1